MSYAFDFHQERHASNAKVRAPVFQTSVGQALAYARAHAYMLGSESVFTLVLNVFVVEHEWESFVRFAHLYTFCRISRVKRHGRHPSCLPVASTRGVIPPPGVRRYWHPVAASVTTATPLRFGQAPSVPSRPIGKNEISQAAIIPATNHFAIHVVQSFRSFSIFVSSRQCRITSQCSRPPTAAADFQR